MAKADTFAQLKDIHLPETIGWWPLAPGWYGLMLLILFAMMALTYVVYQRHAHALPKNQALALLDDYKAQYEKDRDAPLASARISELLRRVALVYFPRSDVASLYGDAWIVFLNQTSRGIDFEPVKFMLLDLPFKTSEAVNLQPLILRARRWIKQRSIPCSN